jgi:hypothetical protein
LPPFLPPRDFGLLLLLLLLFVFVDLEERMTSGAI